MKNQDREIEQFPVEKRQIRWTEPPELIFPDVDEDPDEADFIRVDDLFKMEAGQTEKLTGRLSFTFFPNKKGDVIGSRLSRLIRRSLLLCAVRLEKSLEKVRVRPKFVQFRVDLGDPDAAEEIAREFRNDLEDQMVFMRKDQNEERFWSSSCFVCPVDKDFSDDSILRIAASFQDQ